MPSLKSRLEGRGLLRSIALPGHIDALLTGLTAAAADPGSLEERASATVGFAATPLGFVDLSLTPPGPEIPFTLRFDADPATEFKLWLRLADITPLPGDAQPPFSKVFQFVEKLPGTGLTAARVSASDPNVLEATPADKVTVGVEGIALLIEGKAGGEASLAFRLGVDAVEDIITLNVTPPTVLLGGSQFGLGLEGGIVIDQSVVASAAGPTTILGKPVIGRPADTPTWRGISIRKADFYLPPSIPFMGSTKAETYLDIGTGASTGIDLSLAMRVEPPGKPAVDVLIECHDPTATGLTSFLPTLVEAAVTLPPSNNVAIDGGNAFNVAAGQPLVARARFVRDVSAAQPQTAASFSLEGQGDNGILSVINDGSLPSRAVLAAGAFATALIADNGLGGSDASQPALVTIHEILVAGLGLSVILTTGGRAIVHAVEVATQGNGLPVGGPVTFKVDYSVDVPVIPLNIGVMSIGLDPQQPMRVRLRAVELIVDPLKSGIDMFRLDYSRADMEIEDPGLWKTSDGPLGPLFDIIGSRSGRGSMWVEVDLQFKLNLGPVKVSGATIRANLAGGGGLSAELRGLQASVDIPGLVDGRGAVLLLKDGFAAELDVSIVPLQLRADASILVSGKMVVLNLGVDLPAAIPLFSTGLGIYGVGGLFGAHAGPKLANPANPVLSQLQWQPAPLQVAFEESDPDTTIGVQAVVGTFPDLGFSFSAKAGLFLTVPDIVIRASLDGAVFAPRKSIADTVSDPPPAGLSYRGLLVIDEQDGVTIALTGSFIIPHLVELTIPIGAHFSFDDPSDWFLYIGDDGAGLEGRSFGPVRGSVLPDTVSVGADFYLMLRGKGIRQWPADSDDKIPDIADGFVVAFGFGFHFTIGLEPIVWAEVHASADILLATRPMLLAGFGTVGGSLNLGPFSIGIDAALQFVIQDGASPYLKARVCGHIDLFFFDLEGCVEIVIADSPKRVIPFPDVHPLDRIENNVLAGSNVNLIDDRYRKLPLHPTDPARAGISETLEGAPTVWPDALIELQFSPLPILAAGFMNGQFSSGLETYPSGAAPRRIGGDFLFYDWTLTKLALTQVPEDDPNGPGTPVPGPLAAAWQAGRSGVTGSKPEPVEAVLLSPQGDFWLNRLPTGRPADEYDPMGDYAQLCQAASAPKFGWALGETARWIGDGFDVPPESCSPDPLSSRTEGFAQPGFAQLPARVLDISTAQLLPPPFGFRPPRIVPFNPTFDGGRVFSGYLEFGAVQWPAGGDPQQAFATEATQTVSITLTEPLLKGVVWLIVKVPPRIDAFEVHVNDEVGSADWQIQDDKPMPDGGRAIAFGPPHSNPVAVLNVRWRVGFEVGLVGIGGITASAQAAADAANKARADEVARAKDGKNKGPLKGGDGPSASSRCLLAPGKLYRLDVDFSWHAELSERDDGGKLRVVKNSDKPVDPSDPPNPTDPNHYVPKVGAPPVANARSFWFRTAAPHPAGQPSTKPDVTLAKERGEWTLSRLDVFEPEMLNRHLTGYTPAQSETFRFRHDPLNAHFRVGHVAGLAAVYGYELVLGLRRLDAKGPEGEEKSIPTVVKALSLPSFLNPVDAIRYTRYVNAACELPTPGMTLEGLAELAPLAWYELFVDAKPLAGFAVAEGRLEGVTFRASRWLDPTDMLSGLGLPVGSLGQATGDLVVPLAHALAGQVLDEDAAYEAAIDALGLSGWPPASEPRLSLLWSQGADPATSLLTGVMIESPEPIHRPGRSELGALSALTGPDRSSVAFDILRLDRAGSRLIALTAEPFVPRPQRVLDGLVIGPPRLSLTLSDPQPGGTPIVGSVMLPVQPGFAEV